LLDLARPPPRAPPPRAPAPRAPPGEIVVAGLLGGGDDGGGGGGGSFFGFDFGGGGGGEGVFGGLGGGGGGGGSGSGELGFGSHVRLVIIGGWRCPIDVSGGPHLERWWRAPHRARGGDGGCLGRRAHSVTWRGGTGAACARVVRRTSSRPSIIFSFGWSDYQPRTASPAPGQRG
jgi:hypothetical protein